MFEIYMFVKGRFLKEQMNSVKCAPQVGHDGGRCHVHLMLNCNKFRDDLHNMIMHHPKHSGGKMGTFANLVEMG